MGLWGGPLSRYPTQRTQRTQRNGRNAINANDGTNALSVISETVLQAITCTGTTDNKKQSNQDKEPKIQQYTPPKQTDRVSLAQWTFVSGITGDNYEHILINYVEMSGSTAQKQSSGGDGALTSEAAETVRFARWQHHTGPRFEICGRRSLKLGATVAQHADPFLHERARLPSSR